MTDKSDNALQESGWLELEASDDSWLDITPVAKLDNEANRALTMQQGFLGKNRTWATDGEYIWFRRKQSNPETLQRHNAFVAAGDYQHIETQDDVEVYKLMPQSKFIKHKTLDLAKLKLHDVRRQAILAVCRRDWKTFLDICGYIKEIYTAKYHTAFADQKYAEDYIMMMSAVKQRHGPSPGEINRELAAILQTRGDRGRVITLNS